VADAPDHPPGPSSAASSRRRLFWPVLIVCWISLAVWGWHLWRRYAPPRMPRRDLPPLGVYDTVAQVVGPSSLRLRNLGVVRLAGLVDPSEPADCDRLVRRLAALAPPGTRVYVEPEPAAAAAAEPIPASVFLPPPGAGAPEAFPYGESLLLGAVLVREGLALVDPALGYRYRAEFQMLEHDARRHRRGLWGRR